MARVAVLIRRGGLPWATIVVVGAGAILALLPSTAPALEYRRDEAPAAAWRLATAQLVHWSPAMAAGDLLLLFVSGWIVERSAPRVAHIALGLGAVMTAAAVVWLSGVERYRGSSGLGSATFAAAALVLARSGSKRVRHVAALAGAIFAAKLAAEFLAPSASAFSTLPPGVRAVPAVHLAAGLAGAVAATGASWFGARPARVDPPADPS